MSNPASSTTSTPPATSSSQPLSQVSVLANSGSNVSILSTPPSTPMGISLTAQSQPKALGSTPPLTDGRVHKLSLTASTGSNSSNVNGSNVSAFSTVAAISPNAKSPNAHDNHVDDAEDVAEALLDEVEEDLSPKKRAILSVEQGAFGRTHDLGKSQRAFQKAFEELRQHLIDNGIATKDSDICANLKTGVCMVDGVPHLLDDSVPGFAKLGRIHAKNFNAARPTFSNDFQGAVTGGLPLTRGRPSFVKPLEDNEPLFKYFRPHVKELIKDYSYAQVDEILARLDVAELSYAVLRKQINDRIKMLKAGTLPADPKLQSEIRHEIAELEAAENRLKNIDWFAIGRTLTFASSVVPPTAGSTKADKERHLKVIQGYVKADKIAGQRFYTNLISKNQELTSEQEAYCKDIAMLSSDRISDGDYFSTHRDPIERLLFVNVNQEMGLKALIPTAKIREGIKEQIVYYLTEKNPEIMKVMSIYNDNGVRTSWSNNEIYDAWMEARKQIVQASSDQSIFG